MRQIEPRDIHPPEGITPYRETFGKHEYEVIAASIIFASQLHGEWTPLETLPKKDRLYIAEMLKSGHLEQTADGYMLSQHSKERLAKKFPA